MGNPINNDDISLAEVRPKLLPEAGNNLGTKLVIVVCHSDPRGFRRSECLDEIRPAHDSDEFSVFQDWHAFDAMA